MKVGVVNFLNAYPLYWHLPENFQLIASTPAQLADGLKLGDLDIAITSSIEYFRNRNLYSYIPGLCISAKGKVISIRVYSGFLGKKDFIEGLTNKNPLKVYYDSATRSSVAMLGVILHEIYGESFLNQVQFKKVFPPYDDLILNLKNHELLLLIGDTALNQITSNSADLGEVYYRMFKRSFVYALWVYRKEKIRPEFSDFEKAIEYSNVHFDELIADAVNKFGFKRDFTYDYLKNIIRYKLDDETSQDMDFFFQKINALEKLDGFKNTITG